MFQEQPAGEVAEPAPARRTLRTVVCREETTMLVPARHLKTKDCEDRAGNDDGRSWREERPVRVEREQ